MSALEAFGLIAGVASIVALPLAVIVARRWGEHEKLLAYAAHLSTVPFVSTRSLRDYKLSVVFQAEGGAEERISGAYVHFLRFANFGREPIRREDIAPAKRIELQVHDARVLDIAVEAVRRSVSNISLEPDIQFDDDLATAAVDFDFLDYLDGALVRILTTSKPSKIALVGEIIGMPLGIRRAADLKHRPMVGKVGAGLAAVFELSALALTPLVFYWVTGSWGNAWLLALPIVAIFVPLIISLIISETLWPKGGVNFPRELIPRIRGIPFPLYYDRMMLRAGPSALEGLELELVDDSEPDAEPDPG